MPALFMTSLTQTAGHNMAALAVEFVRLSNVDCVCFLNKTMNGNFKYAECALKKKKFYSIHIDKARDVNLLLFPFKQGVTTIDEK